MAEVTFLDFDLSIRQTANEQYRAEVNIPGWRVARVDFESPFSDQEIDSFREVLGGPARDLAAPAGQPHGSPTEYKEKVMSFGRRLYETVFLDDIREGLSRRLTDAKNQGLELRIRLTLDEAPELAALPWEYLFASGQQPHYLVLDKRTPIVRFLPLGGAPPAAQVKPPLNILVMSASPPGYPKLGVKQELRKIKNALEPLVQTKQVTVDVLPNSKQKKATRSALDEQLELGGKQYHIFHFIGHGGFNKENQPGLALEGGPEDKGEIVTREKLNTLLEHFSLRLAVLNACEGATSSRWDAYSGVAQCLVQVGIPAVIAMQFKITDEAAILFAEKFYAALAAGKTAEDALSFARKQIYNAENPTEWGTPVLFTQSEDGILFIIERPSDEQLREEQIKALSGDAKASIDQRNWALAIKKLQSVVELEGGASN